PFVIILIDDMLPTKDTENKNIRLWAFGIPALVFLGIGVIGKVLAVFVLSYTESILLACKGVYFYLEKILLPTRLSMVYEQITPIGIFQEDFFFPVLILIAIAVISIASRAFGKIVSFCMMWYALTLLPNLGNSIKGIESSIYYASDRYVYIPTIGIFFMVACGVAWAIEHSAKRKQILIATLTVLVVTAYGFAAHNYANLWLTPKGYHERIARLYPESLLPRILIGMVLIQEENNEAALPHFEKAVERKPEYSIPRAHLGLTLVKTGEVDRGITELEKALEINSSRTDSYVYLSYAYMLKGDEQKSRELLEEALEKDPKNPNILQMYGILEYRTGNLKNAERYFRSSIAYDPTSIQAKASLARLLNGGSGGI
ncbi:MAG: tetratricopeptide repeat protein, partial [bacterium]|nr:tetratricopeptide repeat protein [bacterium]